MVITFHDTLHGLFAGWGAVTAFLGAKLLQEMMTMREEILYEIFLNIHKVYDALYPYMCLDILAGYGVGPRDLQLLRKY